MARTERPYRENSDFAAFAVRIIERMGTRAADDPDLLPALCEVSDLVECQMHRAITGLRAQGYSWNDIAQRLGTSKQAVQQRFARHVAG